MEYGDEIIARLRAIAPRLTERARATEEARRLPDETIAELAEAGLFSLLVPKRFGGTEADFGTLADAARTIGAACGSTGWLSIIYPLHNWLVALFPEETQAQVWADRPYALIPCALAPTGTAEPADDGGHVLTGRWSWASGIMHAGWVMVTGLVSTGEPRLFLLPRAEVTVHDVWQTSGMRGTGSNDVEITAVHVPAHHSLPLLQMGGDRTPGARLHDNPIYRVPLPPVFALTGAAAVLGIGEGVLTRFDERMRGRVLAYTGQRQRDLMSGQIRLATATADLAAARLLLADAIAGLSADGMHLIDRARARLVAAHVAATARRVVADLCAASGAGAQFLDSPIQRAQRDINTICGHVIFDPDASYALYGRIALGLDPDPLAML